MQFILLGPPGAGKGTQAQAISAYCDIPNISTGDMLREAIRSGNALGEQVEQVMRAGQLVSDEIMIELVQQRIAQPDCMDGFLLDGFPRTLAQAEALRKAQVFIDIVLEIAVNDALIIDRMSGRLTHPSSGRVYHIRYNPPAVPGVDDVTGEALVQRDDDKEETVSKRLQVYHHSSRPLVEYYERWAIEGGEQAPRFFRIDGGERVGQVSSRICAIIDSVRQEIKF